MKDSDILKDKRRRIINSLQNVNSTAENLSSSISSLNRLSTMQNSCYQVDDSSGDGNYLVKLIEKEQSIYSNIVNNIIPSLRNRIESLDWEIADAESREAIEGEFV